MWFAFSAVIEARFGYVLQGPGAQPRASNPMSPVLLVPPGWRFWMPLVGDVILIYCCRQRRVRNCICDLMQPSMDILQMVWNYG